MKKLNKVLIVGLVVSFAALGFTGPSTALAASPPVVNLLTAGNFTILAKTAITTTGVTLITGDIGVSPAAAGAMTGFGQVMDISNTFSTSPLVIGNIYASNYAVPTPTYVGTAVSAMQAAYTDALSRPTSVLNAGVSGCAGTCRDLAGTSLVTGVYTFDGAGNVAITNDFTLSGSATDVWIFQIPGTLDISANKKINLIGGALAANVFWAVAGTTTLEPGSTLEGIVLGGPGASTIAMQNGATLHGRALGQTDVTLIGNTVSAPVVPPVPATLHVVKLVVNGSGGTATPSAFNVYVKNGGVDVAGSPAAGVSAPGTPYSLTAGTYVVSEDPNASYVRTFTGDCNSSGSITLLAGDDKTCTVVNTDIPIPVVISPGHGGSINRIIPVVGILKVPTPLALPVGSNSVTYNYTVWNVGGQQPLTDVKVVDDKCGSVVYVSGDLNNNNKLDPTEKWQYSCTATLSQTTTNTSVVTAYSDDSYRQAAIATAIATVVVGAPALPNTGILPPLINIVKVPSQLTPFPFGGGYVTYSYIVSNPGSVPMHNVSVTDDKCLAISVHSGDTNGNGLLDPGESWAYTCRMLVTVSTRNVATAKGQANGFTAIGYAFANVLVVVPGLPNTGFPPEEKSTPWAPWDTIMLVGALVMASSLLVVILKKGTA
jgi:hypothetical protein